MSTFKSSIKHLDDLLEEIWKQGGDFGDVLANMLNISRENKPELLYAQAEVIKTKKSIREEFEKIEDEDERETYLEPITKIEKLLNPFRFLRKKILLTLT